MALYSLRHDPTFPGMDEHLFGLRWHRLLIQIQAMPALHFGLDANPAAMPASEDQIQPWTTMPLATLSPVMLDPREVVPVVPADANPFGGLAFRDQPHFMPTPTSEWPPAAPTDAPPPDGLIPRSDAMIWSGPALVVFPGEPHDAAGDSAVTRGDLDPVLSAMGPEAHGPPPVDPAAFLPTDASDPSHGLDSGLLVNRSRRLHDGRATCPARIPYGNDLPTNLSISQSCL